MTLKKKWEIFSFFAEWGEGYKLLKNKTKNKASLREKSSLDIKEIYKSLLINHLTNEINVLMGIYISPWGIKYLCSVDDNCMVLLVVIIV